MLEIRPGRIETRTHHSGETSLSSRAKTVKNCQILSR